MNDGSGDSGDRQLLAIMFTDVVGYTALTERDEAAAVRIREDHRRCVAEKVTQFGGELVDSTGDESLSIFHSAVHAVDCALALQAELREDPHLTLRIGIHLGDVLRKGSEVIGDGVNIASRVRPLAEPGGICVTASVYHTQKNRPGIAGRPLGSKKLKNVVEPVEVFALVSAEQDAALRTQRGQRRKRRLAMVGVAVALLLGVGWNFKTPLLAWTALNLPKLMGAKVSQEIGFATASDGIRIAYATAGEGPPLVFVLGWATHLTEGLSSNLYESGWLSSLARNHQVVRYDGRGFGLSDRDVKTISLDDRVKDLEAVVDALGLESFVLYAYSAGGPTALEYTDRHPERVSRLIFGASFGGRIPKDTQLYRMVHGMTDFIRHNWDQSTARAALAEFVAPEANEVERRIVMHFLGLSGEGPQIAAFLESLSHGIDTREQARQVRVPTLVTASDADRTVPMRMSRELASLIPNARFEVIPGASHIGAAVNDPRTIKLVSEFLAETR